jgi:hypothetical protein
MPRFKDIYGPFSDPKRCRFDRLGISYMVVAGGAVNEADAIKKFFSCMNIYQMAIENLVEDRDDYPG